MTRDEIIATVLLVIAASSLVCGVAYLAGLGWALVTLGLLSSAVLLAMVRGIGR